MSGQPGDRAADPAAARAVTTPAEPVRRTGGWCLYVLECADGTWYTGITNDLRRRLARHEGGTASRYTRGRRPLRLVHCERCRDRSSALRKERRLKALTRAQKKAYVGKASNVRSLDFY